MADRRWFLAGWYLVGMFGLLVATLGTLVAPGAAAGLVGEGLVVPLQFGLGLAFVVLLVFAGDVSTLFAPEEADE